jgi:hypothetical protein
MVFKKYEKKIAPEELRENFLTGPANEPIEKALDELKVGKIVLDKEMPKLEKIIFRNQRDPGYPLEFHYSSKTHTFKQYKLIDGEAYTLPLEVVRNLEQCRENIEKYRHNSKGIPEIYIAGYKSHFVCERVA